MAKRQRFYSSIFRKNSGASPDENSEVPQSIEKMDLKYWKNILLHWVTECGFNDGESLNLEHTNIEHFFINLCNHHKKLAGKIKAPGLKSRVENVTKFLEHYYDHFEPHFDDENKLTTVDYIYIYSLLLHFSCVKCPDPYFQSKCQNLSNEEQQCIASFFKELLKNSIINRDTLRHAIANLSQSQNETKSSSRASSGVDSSVQSPKHLNVSIQRVSPNTPKSNLLQQHTRELYNLRAQLETERYEKSALEVQLKQHEERSMNNSKEQKKLQQQIQALKLEVVTNIDIQADNNEGDDQLRKQYRKVISQKEFEISELNDTLSNLKDEKVMIVVKLQNAEKQITTCLNRIKELEITVDTLKLVVEEKSKAIDSLSESKLELEQYLHELRSNSGRVNLDDSNDWLDSTRLSNASDSNGKTENLASTVIDKQLREKVNENQSLQNELISLQTSNINLVKRIRQVVEEQVMKSEIAFDTCAIGNIALSDSMENFLVLSQFVDRLSKEYKEEKQNSKQLNEEIIELKNKHKDFTKKLKKYEMEIVETKHVMIKEEQMNKELKMIQAELKEKLITCENEKSDLMEKFNAISKDFNLHKYAADDELSILHGQISRLQIDLNDRNVLNKEIREKHIRTLQETDQMHISLNELRNEMQLSTEKCEADLQAMKGQVELLTSELKLSTASEKKLREKYEKMSLQLEQKKKDGREADNHLEAIRKELQSRDTEVKNLGPEIAAITQKNSELEERMEKIMLDCKTEKEIFDVTLIEKEDYIQKLEIENNEKVMKVDELENKFVDVSSKAEAIIKLFPELNNNLSTSKSLPEVLDDVVIEISEMINNNKNNVDTIAALKEEISDNEKRMNDLQIEFKSMLDQKIELINDNETLLQETKSNLEAAQLKVTNYENQIKNLGFKQNALVSKVQEKMDENEVQYVNSIRKLEYEIEVEKENNANVNMHLSDVVSECSKLRVINEKIKADLEQAHTLYNDTQEMYADKMEYLSIKINSCEAKNEELIDDIAQFKKDSAIAAQNLMSADKSFNDLSEQINIINTSNENINYKIEVSQKMHIEEEKKLRNIIDEKTNVVAKLEAQVDNMQLKINESEKELENLKLKENKAEVLKEKVLKLNVSLSHEQNNKAMLCKSLETTTEHFNELEKRCAALQKNSEALQQQNDKLEAEVTQKETKLRLLVEEHEQNCKELNTKLNKAIGKVKDLAEEQESNDFEIMDTLENFELIINPTSEIIESENLKFEMVIKENEHTSIVHNQLKKLLNHSILIISGLKEEINKSSNEIKQLSESNILLTKDIKNKQNEIEHLQTSIKEKHSNQDNNLEEEVNQLKESLNGLKKSHEQNLCDNSKLQFKLKTMNEESAEMKLKLESVTDENKKFIQDRDVQLQLIERFKNEELKLTKIITENGNTISALEKKCKQLESTSNKKIDVRKIHLKDNDNASDKLNNKEHVNNLQTELESLKNELDRNNKLLSIEQEKYNALTKTYTNCKLESSKHQEESKELLLKFTELSNDKTKLEDQIEEVSEKLAESNSIKQNLEKKLENLQLEHNQCQKEYDSLMKEYRASIVEIENNNKFVEELQEARDKLKIDMETVKMNAKKAVDQIGELMQKISILSIEKESIAKEKDTLEKELSHIMKPSKSKLKLKTVYETSQHLEKSLFETENELLIVRGDLTASQENCKKMEIDNQKFREQYNALTKRVEKIALKLGDAQARCNKLERENEKLNKSNVKHVASVDSLSRERESIQLSSKTIKDRLVKSEQNAEQYLVKIHELEAINVKLENENKTLDATIIELKIDSTKNDKLKDINEKKLRELQTKFLSTEDLNSRNILEIGGLNLQIEYLKKQTEEIAVYKTKLCSLEEAMDDYRNINELLQVEAQKLDQKNIDISDELTKTIQSLNISKQKCDAMMLELEELRTDLLIIRDEKAEIERKSKDDCAKIENLEKLIQEKDNKEIDFECKFTKLETKFLEKCEELQTVKSEIDELRNEAKTVAIAKLTAAELDATELEVLRDQLAAADTQIKNEQKLSAQLHFDNQILQAKYREAKQRIQDQVEANEERIKEQRLELEGKLEKMKHKMKTLYTDEIAKMKGKQANENANFFDEINVLKAQNKKYEDHTRKLSNQIIRLNDKLLEHQKENAILSTKLKHIESSKSSGISQFKRPNVGLASVGSSSSKAASSGLPVRSCTNLKTNLAMEDEEGQVFDTTYLTDLKHERISDFFNRDIGTEELQYRNSLCPPHLKSSYPAQYNHLGMAEDELKDGPHSLDDSMSALLSTTQGGQRKKISGVTHYKRPGPPTPGKNGGRLSFGGNNELPREILKENHEHNVSSSRTPSRFGFFSSRFSMGNGKGDEMKSCSIRKNMHKRNYERCRQAEENKFATAIGGSGDAVCTSTPRKSKTHDQRRLLFEKLNYAIMKTKPFSQKKLNLKLIKQNITPPDVSRIEVPLFATKGKRKKRITQLLWQPHKVHSRSTLLKRCLHSFQRREKFLSNHGNLLSVQLNVSDEGSEISLDANNNSFTNHPEEKYIRPCPGQVAMNEHELIRNTKRFRNARPSIDFGGNVFSKGRLPMRHLIHELNRGKSRQQRLNNFNQHRNLDLYTTESLMNNNTTDNNVQKNVCVKVEEMKCETFSVCHEDISNCENNSEIETSSIQCEAHDHYDNCKGKIVKQKYFTYNDNQIKVVDGGSRIRYMPTIKIMDDLTEKVIRDWEKIVAETESYAPFEVNKIMNAESSNSDQGLSSLFSNLAVVPASSAISTSIPQSSSSQSNSYHNSHTIYGCRAIYNRRIPNVHTTHARKSSIYIKNGSQFTLFSNRTLTITDLIFLWNQMSKFTKLVIALILAATMFSILGIFWIIFQ